MNAPAKSELAAAESAPAAPPGPPSRLWLWFVAAFAVQAIAWTAWFAIASKNRVQEVPLIRADGR